ncbi:cutinase family protein [Cellulomonas sp. HZM]|uniref:cutinase family protein n=1 Tax=Cellulomonas sp. HZM TaxID=1454010 RepID=UPI0004931741|nr:cutinase family protein [Cellulomonas sp. HZM]
MSLRSRVALAAGLAAALVVSLSAGPASAATPSAPSTVSVSRSSAGGYNISWTGVSGATGYTIYRELPVRADTDGHGWIVTGFTWSAYATVSSSTRSLRTSDLLTSEVNYDYMSGRWAVAAKNSSGTGAKKINTARCASAYFLSARGSGQNPSKPSENPTKYSSGMGDRGLRVYEDARVRLGLKRSQIQANMVSYPAIAIGWRVADKFNYDTSMNIGATNVYNQVNNIVSHCSSAKIILFGYSQGAQAVGNGYAMLSSSAKKHVTQVHLFADAKRNSADPNIYHRPIMQKGQNGIWGARANFTGTTDVQQIMSWCWSSDDICSKDSVPTTIHGSAYDCYEDWAAEHIAARVRNIKWIPSANITHPSCSMKI